MKVKRVNEGLDTDLDFGLTNEQQEKISLLFEKLMSKFNKPNSSEYFDGVVDGINHCHKVINGIKDDYLDGI